MIPIPMKVVPHEALILWQLTPTVINIHPQSRPVNHAHTKPDVAHRIFPPLPRKVTFRKAPSTTAKLPSANHTKSQSIKGYLSSSPTPPHRTFLNNFSYLLATHRREPCNLYNYSFYRCREDLKLQKHITHPWSQYKNWIHEISSIILQSVFIKVTPRRERFIASNEYCNGNTNIQFIILSYLNVTKCPKPSTRERKGKKTWLQPTYLVSKFGTSQIQWISAQNCCSSRCWTS